MANKIFAILIAGFLIYALARYFYMKPKFKTGENIPSFEAVLLDGSEFNINSLRGKYVLVEFWGSWCGPCRQQSPDLVKLYDKYNGQKIKNADGFVILSIGVESDQDKWKNAIIKDDLHWKYHIVQLEQFQSPIAKQFGVRQIPTNYLLNEKGQIISVNATMSELDLLLAGKI